MENITYNEYIFMLSGFKICNVRAQQILTKNEENVNSNYNGKDQRW